MADNKNIELGLEVAKMVIKHGFPVVRQLSETFREGEPSVSDIRNLEHMVPDGESYLKKTTEGDL